MSIRKFLRSNIAEDLSTIGHDIHKFHFTQSVEKKVDGDKIHVSFDIEQPCLDTTIYDLIFEQNTTKLNLQFGAELNYNWSKISVGNQSDTYYPNILQHFVDAKHKSIIKKEFPKIDFNRLFETKIPLASNDIFRSACGREWNYPILMYDLLQIPKGFREDPQRFIDWAVSIIKNTDSWLKTRVALLYHFRNYSWPFSQFDAHTITQLYSWDFHHPNQEWSNEKWLHIEQKMIEYMNDVLVNIERLKDMTKQMPAKQTGLCRYSSSFILERRDLNLSMLLS